MDDGDSIRQWQQPVGICGGIGMVTALKGGCGGGSGGGGDGKSQGGSEATAWQQVATVGISFRWSSNQSVHG